MGCGASRLEPEEQLAPGLRPIRRKIEEVKRRRRRLKRYSIVSTTELLQPEDHADSEEEEEETTMTPPLEQVVEEEEKAIQSKKKDFFVGDEEKKAEEVKEPTAPESVEEEEEEEEEKKGKKLGNVKRAAAEGDEELPGSPSFRFYCTDSVRDSDDDSVKLAGFRNAEKLEEIKEKPQERDDSAENSCEESELKHIKKEKGKKFRALTKALNVRNCYNNPSAASQHNGPHLLSEKAA